MAMNRIQFQAGLSLVEFLARYGREVQCLAALESSRWPAGFVCPHCGETRHGLYVRSDRKVWQCSRCRVQTTVTAGTVFESTKLPLTCWFLAMHLITQSKNNLSALALKRHLGVSYPSAWLIKHKLMQVMADREQGLVLQGRVEVDDAYLGGEKPGKRGRGSENKHPFLAAVQTDAQGHPQRVAFDPLTFTKTAIQDWANRRLAADAMVYSDALPSVKAALSAEMRDYHPIRTGRAERRC